MTLLTRPDTTTDLLSCDVSSWPIEFIVFCEVIREAAKAALCLEASLTEPESPGA